MMQPTKHEYTNTSLFLGSRGQSALFEKGFDPLIELGSLIAVACRRNLKTVVCPLLFKKGFDSFNFLT